MFRYKMPLKSVRNHLGLGGWVGGCSPGAFLQFVSSGLWRMETAAAGYLATIRLTKTGQKHKKRCKKGAKRLMHNQAKATRFQNWAKMSLQVLLTLKLGYLRLECGKVLVNIVLQATVLNRSVIHTIQLSTCDCKTHLASLSVASQCRFPISIKIL